MTVAAEEQHRSLSSYTCLLLPNSPNLYPHFDAIYLYGLHLKVNTWGKQASKKVRKGVGGHGSSGRVPA
jgi:hypothetical protein